MHARQHGRNTSILIVRNQQAEISNLRRANPIRVFRRETLYSIPARKTEFFNFHERKRERRDINVSFHGKREILLLSVFCSCKRENLSFFGFAIKGTMFIRFDDRMISKEQGGRESKGKLKLSSFSSYLWAERNVIHFHFGLKNERNGGGITKNCNCAYNVIISKYLIIESWVDVNLIELVILRWEKLWT